MPATDFARMPDDARVWVFAAARALHDDEQRQLLDRVDGFLAGWAAHGAPVLGARDLRYDRFLLVAADERATGVSGCSIDTLSHAVAALERETRVPMRDATLVFWRNDDGEVQCAPRPVFRDHVREGGVDGDTPVFDNTVTTVGDLRAGWEKPLRDSWHARAFRLGDP